jgi:hypothetical protein
MPQVISSPTDSTTSGGSDLPVAEKPEFELFRACCSASRGESRRVAQLLAQPLRWNVLLELAAFHDVEPLVCQSLLEVRGLIAPDVVAELERRFALNAQRSLRLTHELLRILACMAQHDIEAIPHKGPVLAQTVYGDVALRQFSDLDILIRADDYSRAAAAVRELGYEPSSKLRPSVERAWIKTGYERGFDGPLGKNLLELQWRLVPRFYAVEMDVNDLFGRLSVARVAGQEVRTLSPEDLLLALCVHASKHAWMRLGWACDIAGVVRSQRIDYGVLRERAVALGVVRIVGVSLWLANQLLECPIPPELTGFVEDARELGGRVSRIVARSEHYNTESIEYFRLMLALRERLVDRFKFVWRLLFTPSVGEWEAVELPDLLFPLYRVVRVLRILRRLA